MNWHPESVSIATQRGTRVRVQQRDRLTAAPGTGAVIAIAEGEPLSRVPPARSSAVNARGIEAGTAETRSGSVHESPVRRSRTRPNGMPKQPRSVGCRLCGLLSTSAIRNTGMMLMPKALLRKNEAIRGRRHLVSAGRAFTSRYLLYA